MTKSELIAEFNIFSSIADVDAWYTKWYTANNKWFPSPEEMLEAGKKHIQQTADQKVQALLNKYTVEKSIVLDYNYTLCLINNQNDWKSIGTGAGVGLGLAALMGWSILPVVAIGAAVGGFWKRGEKFKEAKERLVYISNDYAKQCAKSIYDIIKFKTVSEKLSLPPATIVETPRTSSIQSLTLKQLQIKNFLDQRGIKYLLHFTNADNVESIEKNGILSVEELKRRGIPFSYNDSNRLDNELDYISLSVTSINRQLLGSYIHTGRIKNVRVVWISASILYEEIDNPRIYCDRNAAATSCRKGTSFSDLQNMFQDALCYTTTIGERDYDRTRDGRANNEPTDPQSEILFKGCIPTKYILDVKGTSYYGY